MPSRKMARVASPPKVSIVPPAEPIHENQIVCELTINTQVPHLIASTIPRQDANAEVQTDQCSSSSIAMQSVKPVCKSCQEFSTIYPYSFNIFLPENEAYVQQFLGCRHKLTTTYLRCRLRIGMNTFDSGCLYGRERLLRAEARSEEELIQAIDRLDAVFPSWNVWNRGRVDSDLVT